MLRILQSTLTRSAKPAPQTSSSLLRQFHKTYNATLEEQTCTLPDGRTLGYAEYGDLSGTPTFVFHGAPGSRYDAGGLIDAAKKFRVRLICPDRPGHGLSTFQPGRKLLDWPGDISNLASHLKIPKYHVVGQSGGGPYVVACAYASPAEELLGAAVIAGMGPPATVNVRDAGWYTVAALQFMKRAPGLIRFFTNYYMADDARLRGNLRFAGRFISKEDRERLSTPEAESAILAFIKAAYAQGADGAIQDGVIFGSPWGFELKDVKRKVKLFYGSEDWRTPLAFARHYHEHLPDSELVILEGATHFSMYKHDDEVFEKIFGKAPVMTPASEVASRTG